MNYKKMLKKINHLADKMERLSDDELRIKTNKFRKEIKKGYRTQQIVVEAFAVVREADRRVLKMFPTNEQVLGALVLYNGQISEIKTGEGKSLIATMPLYLKSLYMGHAFLVTTNDYLANRDYKRIGKVFEWLGLSVTDGTSDLDLGEVEFNVERKKEIYSADIIYISSGTLGFDVLIDGLAEKTENRFITSLGFALIDEVDQILLDNAQQPLIISGAPKVQSNYFQMADTFVRILREDIEYKTEILENQVWITEKGIERAKTYFSINILDQKFFTLYQHVILALKAHHTFKKNKDYVIENGKIKLLDSKDGRILEGINLQSGLHQAIETKESIEITKENKTVSSITFQNLFRSFHQLSGMSGTVKVAEDELVNTYNLSVKKIKTHKKNIRIDHKPQKYVTTESKVKAVLKKIQELYTMNRAQLIIAGSVETSNLISLYLFDLGIPHNVLNAKSSIKEAQIIKEAGEAGAVTVSTSMAGRGTDIKLTKEAVENGGLAVIITERLINQRVELQAKGRAGRQGEPGDTYIFESLEDDVVKRYMKERVQRYYDRHKNSEKKIYRKGIQACFKQAQKNSEEQAYQQRKQALQYDEILKLQKEKVEESRLRIMELDSISKAIEVIQSNALIFIKTSLSDKTKQNIQEFRRFFLDNIDYNFKQVPDNLKLNNFDKKTRYIQDYLEIQLEKKRIKMSDDAVFLQYLKICMLKAVDVSWSNQVDALDHLRILVQNRVVAQKDPLLEFERESKRSYAHQSRELARLLLRNTALSLLEVKDNELIVTFP